MNVQILESEFSGSVKDFNNQYGSLSSMMSAHHAPPPNFASRMYYREVVITIEPNDFGYWESWANMPAFDKYNYRSRMGSQNSMSFGTKLHELIRNNLRNGDNLTINVNRLNTDGNAIAFPLRYIKNDESIHETFDFREYNISDFKFINNNTKSMYTFDHYKGAGFRNWYIIDKNSFKRLLYGDLPFKLNNTNNTTIRI